MLSRTPTPANRRIPPALLFGGAMVMEVVSTHNNGSLPGAGLMKNKNSSGNGSSKHGAMETAGNGGGGQGGKAPRKLTKNEKRRQKNKQKKAQASEGAVVDKSMAESNGVAVASWPPPAKEEASGVQVSVSLVACVWVRAGLSCTCFWGSFRYTYIHTYGRPFRVRTAKF